ncbi:DUF2063 domain-containing protein [Pseudomonas putida]|uniref:HvfC/BufC N-terminal domain-containing protein n=1 Tax=Pseudomonas putida TaxID=303 RepID=UPI000282172E|nr:DNA-binding domain-containing protein [Pseudomonas putida]EMR45536.1 hypothetical protein PPUTLS46_022631 [Pseudomonas putida LS46]PJX08675.1 DUF2063 domain-containing protein [Pseudomonas putida]HEE9762200.1 putative DNA-binding domain-containing protein [Pseudomonas putida]
MNLSLGQFQQAFIEALYSRPAHELSGVTEQAAFAVYRNTVLAGCVDALRANFPSVCTLVGRAWMDETAAVYARQFPPSDPRLICYGATFPDFLEDIQSQHAVPYLADVARLDLHWTEAFSAPYETCLNLVELAGMTPSDLDHGCLPPRASARWYWCEAHPVYTLWRCAREQVAWPHDQPWVGEGVLFVGTADGVCHQPLGKGGHAFLKACAAGQSLMQASELAQHAETDLDFTEMLGRLMTAQAFRPLAFTGEHPHG